MKSWSRYNHLFHSERFGYFLYNALSNTLLELDEPHFQMLEKIRNNRIPFNQTNDSDFIVLLEENGFLSTEENEHQQLLQKKYQRNAICFNTSVLGLTICPTLACNFSCPYCYQQSQKDLTVMSEETIEMLISFIKSHKDASKLLVSWYGGEPTLAFGVIKTLTEQFIDLFPSYNNAGLITNGYLLDQEKINELNDLKICSIQITLDGNAGTHDKRRVHNNGGATFQRIFDNINALMTSSYKGSCAIRMNIDKTNVHEYQPLRSELLERFKGKKITIYPGHVTTYHDHPYDQQCNLCNCEWTDFTINAYNRFGILPSGGFYPDSNTFNTCTANSHYGYVVGPAGELYKCREDVGKAHMIIGNIQNKNPITNPELVARYSIGTDPFVDPECAKCPVMPICGGGCINKRLRGKQFGEKGMVFCSPYKERLIEYLETYLDTYRILDTCDSILQTQSNRSKTAKGYQILHPEQNRCLP